ncbi:MAG TPA: gluconate 2-dehydrogenase subunit 3 family protein [Blastocatellia bacterium]|nr:gluconate 2-dehydrogenase subunit 3 family protein [Blastocatellia bacterium]
MSDEKDVKNDLTRREALKGIALGVGVGASLPILGQQARADDHDHEHNHGQAKKAPAKAAAPKFFNQQQLALIATISEHIIPTDDHSPGAIAAEVPAFIDLMISESPAETKKLWTDGLAAVDQMSKTKYQKDYTGATKEEQIAILTEISKNEMKPSTTEEKFFRAIKNMTIDGYYTSEIGIHKELEYKGNTYLKEFKGCTHPEHQS